MPEEGYDYIVVGSGAGGGPLAANLAVKGFRVCLIEAGGDAEPIEYQVPSFHALSTEHPEMAWSFFVHHYDSKEDRDEKYRKEHGGVLYPRAGTLGGCTAHNAMITVVPHNSDWDEIAHRTNDPSWHSENMWKYWQLVENCQYAAPREAGHGYDGWLATSTVPAKVAAGDHDVYATIISAISRVAWRFRRQGWFSRIFHFLETNNDPNDVRNPAAYEGVIMNVPLATRAGKRNSTREYIQRVANDKRYNLTVKMNHLATRVLFDGDKRAVGVECWEGRNLYRASSAAGDAQPEKREVRCAREVILAGGTFNTPQLLMLSGVGPKEHLESIGIQCLVDRPGVGSNLQDRYEVGVVSEMKRPFAMLKDASFKPPGPDNPPDPPFKQWQKGQGLYTSNGAMAAMILRSKKYKLDPDLFIFALPGDFHGYFPTYSSQIVTSKKDSLTWCIVKAHTRNTAGTVRLKSSDPRDTPEINFHYFDEGNDATGDDLDSVVTAVKFVREMNEGNPFIKSELLPGMEKYKDDAALRTWVKNNAWGHHASCSCKMGHEADPTVVVDGRFRVIGTKGLRIVDASVFPRIPGFFIVTPIYMISEKAADVIIEDAQRS
jgi:choline dehydrogenase